MPSTARKEWILAYLQKEVEASSVNQDFHEKYRAAFPGYARRETFWGAQPVPQAMRDLRELHKDGSLEAARIGMAGSWQPGFPRWVLSYRLPRKES